MSGRRKPGELTIEDRILWSHVARSIKPKDGGLFPCAPRTVETDREHRRGAAALVNPVAHPPYRPDTAKPRNSARSTDIDPPTRRKLSKGRLPIDATIDLHDLDRVEAHGMLLAFLHRAHMSGLRHVLVITGKGSSPGSAGVLRRAVPQWLGTRPFRGLVGGYEHAARHHGGDGAIYVRLSKQAGSS